MSARAQIIINLPSLRKMLMEDVAWVSDHCLKQACISIQGQIQSSRGRLWQKSATLQFIYQLLNSGTVTSWREAPPSRRCVHKRGNSGCFSHPMQQLRTEAVAARTRKAYIEEAQDDSTWTRWAVILRSWVMTTQSTRRESTLSAPLMMAEVGG